MVVIGDKNIKELVGVVVSDKMDKTIVIKVDSVKVHPKYKKRYTVSTKFYAHDETNQAKEGDMVRVRGCRPYSKKKRWMLIEVNAK